MTIEQRIERIEQVVFPLEHCDNCGCPLPSSKWGKGGAMNDMCDTCWEQQFCPDCGCDPCACFDCRECDGRGWVNDPFDYIGDGTRECYECGGTGDA